jgi:hypothetical protein
VVKFESEAERGNDFATPSELYSYSKMGEMTTELAGLLNEAIEPSIEVYKPDISPKKILASLNEIIWQL